jgi:hypothetical protein
MAFWGIWELFQEYLSVFLCICAIATSLAAGCRISPVKNVSVIFLFFPNLQLHIKHYNIATRLEIRG